MIGLKSINSSIYHRLECKYINLIKESSMKMIELDDEITAHFIPCKYCCNLKRIYMNSKPRSDLFFANMNVVTEINGEILNVHTSNYNWKIRLNPLNQNIELYLKSEDDNYDYYLVGTDSLEKSKNIIVALRYIAHEEKVAKFPKAYKKYALKLEWFADKNNIEHEYDNDELYLLTDIAAWKITYNFYTENYTLFHSPFGEQPLSIEEAKTACYHIQRDLYKKKNPYEYLSYIVKHDSAKKIEKINYKKLPRATKKQKKYYRQARKRNNRKSIENVYAIFSRWDANKH